MILRGEILRNRRSMAWPNIPMITRLKLYGIAILATGLAWLGDLAFQDYFDESSSALFIAAAMLSAWFGGFGPGVAAVGATVASTLR